MRFDRLKIQIKQTEFGAEARNFPKDIEPISRASRGSVMTYNSIKFAGDILYTFHGLRRITLITKRVFGDTRIVSKFIPNNIATTDCTKQKLTIHLWGQEDCDVRRSYQRRTDWRRCPANLCRLSSSTQGLNFCPRQPAYPSLRGPWSRGAAEALLAEGGSGGENKFWDRTRWLRVGQNKNKLRLNTLTTYWS